MNVNLIWLYVPLPIGWILPHEAPTLEFFRILSSNKRTAPGVKSTSPSRARRKVFSACKNKLFVLLTTLVSQIRIIISFIQECLVLTLNQLG